MEEAGRWPGEKQQGGGRRIGEGAGRAGVEDAGMQEWERMGRVSGGAGDRRAHTRVSCGARERMSGGRQGDRGGSRGEESSWVRKKGDAAGREKEKKERGGFGPGTYLRKKKDQKARWRDLKGKREKKKRAAAKCRGWERKTARETLGFGG